MNNNFRTLGDKNSNIIYRMSYNEKWIPLFPWYKELFIGVNTNKYRFYIFKNIDFINFYCLWLNLLYFFQYWPN